MKNAMISQPMRGIPGVEILDTRDRARTFLESEGYTVINTFPFDEWHETDKRDEGETWHPGILFLAKSIERMAQCQVLYMCSGWEKARGCAVVHLIAQKYGLQIIYEDSTDAAAIED